MIASLTSDHIPISSYSAGTIGTVSNTCEAPASSEPSPPRPFIAASTKRHTCASPIFALYSPILLRMGEMRRATAREEEARMKDRFVSTLVIATAIIAAVRLARDENISRPTPRLITVIGDSVTLAKTILRRVLQ